MGNLLCASLIARRRLLVGSAMTMRRLKSVARERLRGRVVIKLLLVSEFNPNMAVGAALSRFCLAVFHCGRSLILSLFLFFNAYVIYIYNIVNTCADVGARVCLKVAFFWLLESELSHCLW